MADVDTNGSGDKVEEPVNPTEVEPTEDSPTDSSKPVESPTVSKLEHDIIRQVEYYFGDVNLSRDKFLIEQIGKDDGWVPLTTLLTFKRLASLSSDAEVIVDAINKSDEGLIEISEDRTKLRRHPERPLPEQNEEQRKEVFDRTVYVKGFSAEETTMEELLEFFEPFNKVANIQMRKYHDKATKTYKFKGSVFVTFARKEQAEEFMNKENLSYNNKDLIRKWRNDYIEEKKLEYKNDKKKNKKEDSYKSNLKLPTGAVIHLEGIGGETVRENIKAIFADLGAEVSYIEFNKGDKEAFVRLSTENSAKPIFDKFEDGKLKVDNVELTARILEGDEEKEFLDKAINSMKSRRQNHNRNKSGYVNKRYVKCQNNRKRRGSPQPDNEPAEKH